MDNIFTYRKVPFLILFFMASMSVIGQQAICPDGIYDPANLSQIEQSYLQALEDKLKNSDASLEGRSGKSFTIPVFVTVLHDDDENDGDPTPTYSTIVRGIDLVNQAFRNEGFYAGDAEIAKQYPFLASVATGIQFELVQTGGSTPGAAFHLDSDPTKQGILDGLTADNWNDELDLFNKFKLQSLNRAQGVDLPTISTFHIYLSESIGGAEGYARFPITAGQIDDGIVLKTYLFGTEEANTGVVVHEIGHYLGLFHTFQDDCGNDDCTEQGDRVCDTPPDSRTDFQNCIEGINSCASDADDKSVNNPFTSDVPDMGENYMDYSPFECMNTFTQGQKDRMIFFLENARSGLIQENATVGNEYDISIGISDELLPVALVPFGEFTTINIDISSETEVGPYIVKLLRFNGIEEVVTDANGQASILVSGNGGFNFSDIVFFENYRLFSIENTAGEISYPNGADLTIQLQSEGLLESLDNVDCTNSVCEYSVILSDDSGDGWDGASLSVKVDGAEVGPYTLEAADGMFSSFSFEVMTGQDIEVEYIAGTNDSENSWQVREALGAAVGQKGAVLGYDEPTSEVVTAVGSCPECCTDDLLPIFILPLDPSADMVITDIETGVVETYSDFGPVFLNRCKIYEFSNIDFLNYSFVESSIERVSPSSTLFQFPCEQVIDEMYFEVTRGETALVEFEAPFDPICYNGEIGFDENNFFLILSDIDGNIVDFEFGGTYKQGKRIAMQVAPGYYEVSYFIQRFAGGVYQYTTRFNGATLTVELEGAVDVDGEPLSENLICNDHVLISVGDCDYQVNADDFLETSNAASSFLYGVRFYDQNGTRYLGPNFNPNNHLNERLQYRVQRFGSDNYCWGEVTFENKSGFEIACQNDTVLCTNPVLATENLEIEETFGLSADEQESYLAGNSVIVTIDESCGDNGDASQRYFGEVINAVEIEASNPNDILVISYVLDGARYISTTLTGETSYDLTDLFFERVPSELNRVGGVFEVRTIANAEYRSENISINITHGVRLRGLVVTDECSGDLTVEVISTSFKPTGCDDNLWYGGVLERTVKVSNNRGNSNTCTQRILIQTPTFDQLSFPGDAALNCDDLDIDVSDLTAEETAKYITPELLSSVVGPTQSTPFFGCEAIDPDANPNLCKITYTYTDQVLKGCVGIKIIRNWEVINWCTKVVQTQRQTILIDDVEAPAFTGADVLMVGTKVDDCVSDFKLDSYYEDACSDIVSMTVKYDVTDSKTRETTSYTIDGLTSNVEGLPLGEHELFIKALDACGNETEGYDVVKVVVEDNSAPIVIMDDSIRVTIGSSLHGEANSGRAVIRPEDIDEGSFDNCGIASYEVRRLDGCLGASSWGDYVEFACCDVAVSPLRVELRVTDIHGNSAVSWGFVEVESSIFEIECPADQGIACVDFNKSIASDGTNDTYGLPTALDGCSPLLLDFWFEDNVGCTEGTFTRYWVYDDNSPKTAPDTCVQVLTIFGESNQWQVTFPANDTVSCLEELPGVNSPIIEQGGCNQVLVKCDTLQLTDAETNCGEYQITYTVIDNCAYDINGDNNFSVSDPTGNDLGDRTYNAGDDGAIRYTQRIFIVDNNRPVFTCSADTVIINSLEAECEGSFTLTATATDECATGLTYKTSVDVDQDGIFFEDEDINTNTNRVSTTLAHGTYAVSFEARDGCGNRAICERVVTIRDGKAPTPICYAGLSTAIMPEGGMIEVWAIDFLKDAVDNCTDKDYLLNSAKGRINISGIQTEFNDTILIDCQVVRNTGGVVPIDIQITDEAGNTEVCRTTILVRDNLNTCPQVGSSANAAIGGLVTTTSNQEVSNVSITLNDGVEDMNTAEKGAYAFGDLNLGGAYTVTPSRNDDFRNGVTVSDLTMLLRHVLGRESLTSAEQMIAADIDKNGALSVTDISQLQRLILQKTNKLPNNTSWRFVDATFAFDKVDDVLSSTFPEAIELKSLTQNELSSDFTAIKVGDLDGNAKANDYDFVTESRSGKVISLNVANQKVEAGETYEVVFNANEFDAVLGYQFGLDFNANALDLIDVVAKGLDVNEQNFNLDLVNQGKLATVFASANAVNFDKGSALFSLTFKVKTSGNIADFLNVSDDFRNEGAVYEGGAFAKSAVSLSFDGAQATSKFELMQNQPNPFTTETVIGFVLPNAAEATLTVFDMSGKILSRIEGDYSAGYNQVKLDGASLQAGGVLIYELATDRFSETKRMILVR